MGDIKFAIVDAFNQKFEVVETKNLYRAKDQKKRRFLPEDDEDFDENASYAELIEECGNRCRKNHEHKTYRVVKIRALAGKLFSQICCSKDFRIKNFSKNKCLKTILVV